MSMYHIRSKRKKKKKKKQLRMTIHLPRHLTQPLSFVAAVAESTVAVVVETPIVAVVSWHTCSGESS